MAVGTESVDDGDGEQLRRDGRGDGDYSGAPGETMSPPYHITATLSATPARWTTTSSPTWG